MTTWGCTPQSRGALGTARALTPSPSPKERPHREPGHRPVPGGGAVQGRELRAAAGHAAVLGAEVDHQELGQARAALTLPLPQHGPQVWEGEAVHQGPEPSRARAVSGWDLSPAAGSQRAPSPGAAGPPLRRPTLGSATCQEHGPSWLGLRPSTPLRAGAGSTPRAFPRYPAQGLDGHPFCMC